MTQDQTFSEKMWKAYDQVVQFRHRAALELVPSGAHVLDIGCGDGLFLRTGQSLKQVTGVGADFSHTAIQKAEAQSSASLRFVSLDATGDRLPFDDGSFDVVVALDVLEHLLEPERLLSEMKRVSRKEIIIGVPNFSSLPSRIQTVFGKVPENNKPKKGHMYWFNWRILNRLLEASNLKVIDRRVNAQMARIPMIGSIFSFLAWRFPNLFALSFVVRVEK